MFNDEPADYSDPRALLEEKEQEQSTHDLDSVAMATVFGRVFAWVLAAPSLEKMGFRVHVAAHKLRPDLIGGMSFEKMASMLGQGRSSAHKLSKEFSETFGVRGMLDKSDDARRKSREAWRRANIIPCPTKSPPLRQPRALSA